VKLGSKILSFVVAIVAAAVLMVSVLVMRENEDYHDQTNRKNVEMGVDALQSEIGNISDKVKYCAELLAKDNSLIVAVEYVNFLTLKAILNDINAELALDAITVTDKDGDVLIRHQDPDKRGDNIGAEPDVQMALAGDVSLTMDKGSDSEMTIRAAAPIENQRGDIIGTVVTGCSLKNAPFLQSLKKGHGMEFFVFSGDRQISSTLSRNGTGDMDKAVRAAVIERGEEYFGESVFFGEPYIARYIPLKDMSGSIVGALAGAMSLKDVNEAMRKTILHAAIVAAAVIIVSVCILLLYVRYGIRKPMLALADAAAALANGHLNVMVQERKRKDEIGMLRTAILQVVQKIGGLIREVEKIEGENAQGNLLARADESAYEGEYGTLIEGYNKTVNTLVGYLDKLPLPVLVLDKSFSVRYINENGAAMLGSTVLELTGRKCHELFRTEDCLTGQCVCFKAMDSGCQQEGETTAHLANGTVLKIRYMGIPIRKDGEVVGALEAVTDLTQIKRAYDEAERHAETLTVLLEKIDEAAGLVETSARQVSDGSQMLSQGAVEQAAAIQQLLAATAEISRQTKDNAGNSEKASAAADKTRCDTAAIDEKMGHMLRAMDEINAASHNISKIIKTIDDIAFQTNILALNAAVEAARAGANGKGFAVVADEVRSLAAKSAAAAKETEGLIRASLSAVAQGSKLAEDTAQTLKSVVEGIGRSAALMDEVAAASKRQSLDILQVEKGIERVSVVIQNITATAEESAAASEELSGQAEVLAELAHSHHKPYEAAGAALETRILPD